QLIVLSTDLENSHLSYIVLIPFISAALIYFNRRKIFFTLQSSPLAAVAVFSVAGVVYLLSYTHSLYLSENSSLTVTTSALIALWVGGFLLSYGFQAFKAALFPLLFLGFSI